MLHVIEKTPPAEAAQSNKASVAETPFLFKKLILRTALAEVRTDNVSQAAKIFFDESSEISLASSHLARRAWMPSS